MKAVIASLLLVASSAHAAITVQAGGNTTVFSSTIPGARVIFCLVSRTKPNTCQAFGYGDNREMSPEVFAGTYGFKKIGQVMHVARSDGYGDQLALEVFN